MHKIGDVYSYPKTYFLCVKKRILAEVLTFLATCSYYRSIYCLCYQCDLKKKKLHQFTAPQKKKIVTSN